jgi:acetolactate synthase-1/2/3 large subunit
MMCIEELHTLVAEELDVTVFVFNNNDYAIISEEAERSYNLGQSEYGWTDAPIDFMKVAEGMGLRTERAENPKEIIQVAQETLNAGPTLVEIPTDPHEPQASEYMTREF